MSGQRYEKFRNLNYVSAREQFFLLVERNRRLLNFDYSENISIFIMRNVFER